MNNNELIKLLTIILGCMICILFFLGLTFIILKIRDIKQKNNIKTAKKENTEIEKKNKDTKTVQQYNKQSIFKFMDFDEITDNMIIQNNGKRFLMITECQGINYDLMSGLEKNSVEQGFLQFLNTLRYPIQIYVQTRTVNLGNSINTYKQKVEDISREYRNTQTEYTQKVRSGEYTQKELDEEKRELVRQKNLYEYGLDIINNTEKMSLNKNILSKHYYIIISYYVDELGNRDFDKEEIRNIAFSELYTKSQSIIGSLSMCGIKSRILDSTELSELLYVAYNRDDAELYDLQRILNAGYNDLYSTAPNVLDKKMKELDKVIEEKAMDKANDLIIETMEDDRKERMIKQKEENLDSLINSMVESIISENENIVGKEIADKAKKKLKTNIDKKNTEEGGKTNEKTKRRRTTSK